MRNEDREVCLDEVLRAVRLIKNWGPTDSERTRYVGTLKELTLVIESSCINMELAASIEATIIGEEVYNEIYYNNPNILLGEHYPEIRKAFEEIDKNSRKGLYKSSMSVEALFRKILREEGK